MNVYVSMEVVHMKHFFIEIHSMLTCNSNMTCNMTASEQFTYDQVLCLYNTPYEEQGPLFYRQ